MKVAPVSVSHVQHELLTGTTNIIRLTTVVHITITLNNAGITIHIVVFNNPKIIWVLSGIQDTLVVPTQHQAISSAVLQPAPHDTRMCSGTRASHT